LVKNKEKKNKEKEKKRKEKKNKKLIKTHSLFFLIPYSFFLPCHTMGSYSNIYQKCYFYY